MPAGFFEKSSAVLSICGAYRYLLTRTWDKRLAVCTWLMLNPSVADAETDDPTIRRCIGFAKHWAFGGIRVVNLYALRSPDSKVLGTAEYPIAEKSDPWKNDRYILAAIRQSTLAVAGFGNGSLWNPRRVLHVRDMVRTEGLQMKCLGLTASGQPVHPLYIPYARKLKLYV